MGSVQSSTDRDAEKALSSPMLSESVAADATQHPPSAVNSFHAAASKFLDVNSEFLLLISKLEDHFIDFVTDQLKRTTDTLELLTAVKKSLQEDLKTEFLVHQSIALFDEFDDHEAALKKLSLLKNHLENPFTNLSEELQPVIDRHQATLEELSHRRKKLTLLIGNVKTWRKNCTIVYYLALAAVVICTLVLAVRAAPPPVITGLTAASGNMALILELVEWICAKRQRPQEIEMEIDKLLSDETNLAMHELNTIKLLLKELEIKKTGLIDFAEFAVVRKDRASLKMALIELRLKAKHFYTDVVDLIKEVDWRINLLKMKTATVLCSFADTLEGVEFS